MKRPKPKKRRDRASGRSPYDKRQKSPIQYSGAYYAWKSHFVARAKREEREGNSHV